MADEIRGTLVKIHGGFYEVISDQGQIRCHLRGNLKKTLPGRQAGRTRLTVGDLVIFQPGSAATGIITSTLPRKALLARPRVANVDQVIIVFSTKAPDLDTLLLDRFLVNAEKTGIRPVICINKRDLIFKRYYDAPLPGSSFAEIETTYQKAGYPLVWTSATAKAGIDELKKLMEGKLSVLAGPSGVGKTSLLNAVKPDLNLKVGALSLRGRHTTTNPELLILGKSTLVADTPGFTRLEWQNLSKDTLARYFPEFERYLGRCRFTNCRHRVEPGCAVKGAVKLGEISRSRYNSYLKFLAEL